MRLMRMKCRPCSISRGLTPARFGEIRETREILHPFREGSVSIRGTALGAGIDRDSMSEAPSSDGHNGPRRQRQRFPAWLRTGDEFDRPNAAKSAAERFLPRFPAVFARLRTTSAGEKHVTPGC